MGEKMEHLETEVKMVEKEWKEGRKRKYLCSFAC
jgi:hypothetical protein